MGRNAHVSIQVQWKCLLDKVIPLQFSSVHSLSHVQLFATPWTTACQASLSIINSQIHPKPCPLSQWCHPTISSSVIPFSSCPQSFPASGSFQMSQLFESGGQSIGVSASASSSTYKGANKSVEALRGNICFNFDRWIQIFRSGPGIQASLLRQKKKFEGAIL